MRLLYIEDDQTAAAYVTQGLEAKGFAVDNAVDARTGRALAESSPYDLIILDVMLPDGDGMQLLAAIRAAGLETPILVLSARGEANDRIRGLDLGADDYLRKPFAFGELVARIRAITRRNRGQVVPERLCVADLVLYTDGGTVERRGRRIDLSRKQFAILEYLLRNRGRVVSRAMILDEVWGYGFEAQSNMIDVHMNGLRARIDRDFEPKLIHTARGHGYLIEEPRSRTAATQSD
jgi:DNA-binding response OmpR family regulator